MPPADFVDRTGVGGTQRFDLAAVPDIEVIAPRDVAEPAPDPAADAPGSAAARPPGPALAVARADAADRYGPRVPGGEPPAGRPPADGRHATAGGGPVGGSDAERPPPPSSTPMTQVSAGERPPASAPHAAPPAAIAAPGPERDPGAPPANGVATGDVDLHGEWTLADDDAASQSAAATGRLSRLVGALRSERPAGVLGYRGAALLPGPTPYPSADAPPPPAASLPLAAPIAAPLLAVLDARPEEDDLIFTPADIEMIMGRPLPEAATDTVRWWMLSGQPWRRAGYAATLDPEAGDVTFHRL